VTIKKATVRFYIDADLLGLAKILVEVRSDVTYPGDLGGELHKRYRPACPIASPAVKDKEWLPEVCRHGWLIITRDWHINDHRAEITAVHENQARMVTLSSKDARTKFGQLEVLMCRWREIESKLTEPGPFIYQATRTKLTPVEIGTGRGR
jgi:PIN like domain